MPNKTKLSKTAQIFSSDHHPLLNHPISLGFAIYSVVAVAVSTMLLVAVYFAGYSSAIASTNSLSNSYVASQTDSLTVAEMTALVERQLGYQALSATEISLDLQSELADPAPVIAVAETYSSDQAFLNRETYLDPRVDTDPTPLGTVSGDFWISMAIIVFALGSVVAVINYLDEQHLLRKAETVRAAKAKKSTKTGRYTASKKKVVKKASKSKVSKSKVTKVKATAKKKTSAKRKVASKAKK